MKDINKEILDLIVAHKSGGKTVEESLGIKICKSEEDHLFVTSSSNRNIKTYTKCIGKWTMSTQSEIAINATKAKEAKYDAEAKELFQHPFWFVICGYH